MRGHPWTDDGIALLRKLWTEGATAAVIGQRLGGLSRSAVLGKVFRLRLGEGDDGTGPGDPISRAGDTPSRRRGRQPRKRIAALPLKPPGRLTLLELSNENCRWPSGRSGRFFFCGVAEADVENGIPYCRRHMRRACNASVSFEKSGRPDFSRAVNLPKIGAPV